jgi:hypothetical protein
MLEQLAEYMEAFMALCKPGLIVDQYGRNLELTTTSDGNFPYSISTKSVEQADSR